MDSKINTSSFYSKALAAALYGDTDAISKATKEALSAGIAREEIDTALFAVGFEVADRKTEDGKAKAAFDRRDRPALKEALHFLGIQLRYNLRSARIEVCIQGEWMQFKNNLQAYTRAKIGELFNYRTDRGPRPLHYGAETWTLFRDAVLKDHEVDPFKEWIESLPEWDGTGRIDSYLSDLFTVEPSPLALWAAQFLVLGPIQRAFEPGSKLDEMPVMVGPQNIGKSAVLRCLMPEPHQAAWFADGLHLAADPKTRAEALQGKVIVEASEMAGSTRADLESLKSFISRQDDGSVRMAYRRDPETTLRRAVICGTTNRENCLPNDSSGNRRFIPVDLPTSTQAIEPYMETHRIQLWAEALNRYRDGMRAGLPRTLKGTAAAAAEVHRNRDELLEDRVDALTIQDGALLVEIAEAVGLVPDIESGVRLAMREAKRLAAALRNAGWSERRDSRARRWFRDDDAL